MTMIPADEGVPVSFRLNGRLVRARLPPRIHLADALRHTFHATGTHVGCEHGVCGACTVLVDGRAVRSCLLYAVQVEGSQVETVEGLACAGGALSVLQQAFHEHFALQCGFCTPGILMSAKDFLAAHSEPTEAEIRDMLSGHLCRCTGYESIVRAVMAAAERLRPPPGSDPVAAPAAP